MSRAEVDLLLFTIDQTDRALRRFERDPAGFVAKWETDHARREGGVWQGGTLTDDERSALLANDWGALYGMGAHPNLLWQVVRALHPERDVGELVAEYRALIEPYGRPSFET